MRIVSITEILECNEWIRGQGLEFKIHLRDACGKQSCWIESLSDKNDSGQWKELYKTLEEFFPGSGSGWNTEKIKKPSGCCS